MAHRDMILTVRDRVARLIQQGKTQKDAVARKPAADFEATIPQTETNEDRFVAAVYADLRAAR
jgi:cyclase